MKTRPDTPQREPEDRPDNAVPSGSTPGTPHTSTLHAGSDPSEVVTFGEAMAALRSAGPLRLGGGLRLSVAGAEANVAIGLARLGHTVEWIGRVGDDELGALVLRTLRAEAVDVRGARIDTHLPTGLFLLERRLGEITRVRYYRRDSAGSALLEGDVSPALRPGVRILHLSGITPALGPSAAETTRAAVQRARQLGIAVSLDVNYRSQLWTPQAARDALRPLATDLDILFAAEGELVVLADDPHAEATEVIDQMLAVGIGAVVLKRGAEGATAYTADGATTVPAYRVRVVDVVGAGDAFVAGYLSATLDGLEIADRLYRGAAVSAFAVACEGDWEGLPTRADLALLDTSAGTTIR